MADEAQAGEVLINEFTVESMRARYQIIDVNLFRTVVLVISRCLPLRTRTTVHDSDFLDIMYMYAK